MSFQDSRNLSAVAGLGERRDAPALGCDRTRYATEANCQDHAFLRRRSAGCVQVRNYAVPCYDDPEWLHGRVAQGLDEVRLPWSGESQRMTRAASISGLGRVLNVASAITPSVP